MIRIWLAIAGLGGLASVAAGALAAHRTGDARAAELLRTGALYGMVHATALIAVIAMVQGRGSHPLAACVAGCAFAAGIVLFCCSLLAMGAGAPRWLGWFTPFGGGAFMVGWAALAILALRRR
jgi:uncharacterized membrane protein YgdD (TMEM256/DUF423 family)